jgi:hypothetical protein
MHGLPTHPKHRPYGGDRQSREGGGKVHSSPGRGFPMMPGYMLEPLRGSTERSCLGSVRSIPTQGTAMPRVGPLHPDPRNARAEGRNARSRPKECSCRGAGCSIPSRGRSCRGAGCSFPGQGMPMPRVGMLHPEPGNARAEGQDVPSRPREWPCRGSGRSFQLSARPS